MKESPDELDALQRLLDDSIASAGGHLRKIITVNSAGEPRTSCVDGHFLHGTWIFGTAATARKARHLRARPALSVTYADGEKMALFAHGRAEYIAESDTGFQPLDEHYIAHYGSSPRDWGPAPVFIRLHPHWMVAYAMDAATFPAG